MSRLFELKATGPSNHGFELPDHQGQRDCGGGAPPIAPGAIVCKPSFVFFTYSHVKPDAARWEDTGIPNIFYTDIEAARRDIVELREEITADLEAPLRKFYLEKIETHPVSKDTILALLNQGIGAFIKTYEVVDIIE